MLRALLAERFKLVIHMETRPLPVYALVLARLDGRFGPNLRRSEIDCVPLLAAADIGHAVAPSVPTGLTGYFDVGLIWTVELPSEPSGVRPPGEPPRLNGVVVDQNGPSLFTALQEQLGLKLDSQRGPVDVSVIDSVEHPTGD